MATTLPSAPATMPPSTAHHDETEDRLDVEESRAVQAKERAAGEAPRPWSEVKARLGL